YCYFASSLLMNSLFFFFFSSRRRHTRSKRDWSSDVCSSDLTQIEPPEAVSLRIHLCLLSFYFSRPTNTNQWYRFQNSANDHYYRSEERRVGKECRFWWSTYS